MKTKLCNEAHELIMRSMLLTYLIHCHTDYCTFVRFFGHCDSLELEVRTSKENWQSNECSTMFNTSQKWMKDEGEYIKYLKSKIEVLESIIREGAIPYDMLDKVLKHVIHDYEF